MSLDQNTRSASKLAKARRWASSFGVVALLLSVIAGPASAGTYDGAMGRTNYVVMTGDVNGDGQNDVLMKAVPKIVLIPLDDDLSIPIPVPAPSPTFALISASFGTYTIELNLGAEILSSPVWQAATQQITYAGASGNFASSVTITAVSSDQASFVVSMSAETGQLQLTSVTAQTVPGSQGAVAASLTPVAIEPPHLGNENAGSLPGNLGVGNDGAATYSIPLPVPPGTAGMEPKLALNYSSNSPNARVGFGWSLGGGSTIHRCTKTIAQDNAVGRVSFDTEDRLCLDGQRLMRANGPASGTDAANDIAYWAIDAEYRTEQESFRRITRLSNGGFKVESKDGRIAYYGIDSNSAIAAQGRTDGQPLAWGVARVEDRSSNYFTYQYSNDSTTGEYLLQQIRYSGNANAALSPDLAVRFIYEAREDAKVEYFGGSRNDLRSRLTHVQTFTGTATDGSGGVLVRDHTIHYVISANSGRSLVDWMQACAVHPTTGVSECLPKTNFESGVRSATVFEAVPGVAPFTLPANGINPIYRFSGDFDGTGLTTFIIASTDNSPYGPNITGSLYIRTPDGVVSKNYSAFTLRLWGVKQVMGVDLNGDGRDDLVYGTVDEKWSYCLNTSTGPNQVSFDCPQESYKGAINIVDFRNEKKPHIVSSFDVAGNATDCSLVNGAMVCEVLHMNSNTSAPIYKINLSAITLGRGGVSDFYGTWNYLVPALDPNRAYITGSCTYVIGNGVATSSTGCDMYRGVMVCTPQKGKIDCKVVYEERLQKYAHEVFFPVTMVGDINGDGLTDFSYYQSSGSPTSGSYTCLSKETAVDCQKYDLGHWGIGDWRGDGINSGMDLNYTTNTLRICRYAIPAPICEEIARPTLYSGFQRVSMDDSGVPQFLLPDRPPGGMNPEAVIYTAYRLYKDPSLDRLIRVTNGFGNKEEADYARGDNSSVYSRNAVVDGVEVRPTYPHVAAAPGVMVQHLRRENGQGNWLSVDYSYEGFAYDVTGRGSLGFTKTKFTDAQSGITKTTAFSHSFPFVGEALRLQEVSRTGILLRDTTNSYNQKNIIQANGSTTFFTFLDSSVTVQKDLDSSAVGKVSSLNEYSNDGYANLVQATVTKTPVSSTQGFVSKEVYGYKNDSVNWLIGLQESSVSTKTDPVSGTGVSRTTVSSHDLTGRVDTQTIEPNDVKYRVLSTFEYGAPFGLLTKQVQKWQDPYLGPTSRNVLDATYDNRGRFILTRRNALGYQSAASYIPGTGAVASARDVNGLLTTWTVDGYGQVEKERRQDNTENRTYRKKCSGDCPLYAVSALIADQFNNGTRTNVPRITYIDAAAHTVQTRTWGFDGREIISGTRYDTFGRLLETEQPHYVGESTFLARSQIYDDLNRVVVTITLDLGGTPRFSTTEYHGLTQIHTNPKSQKRTELRNVNDQITQIVDAKSGVTQFGYDPNGNLNKTIDPAGNVVAVDYDIYGRKTDLRDPDLGWIHYVLDPLGRTVSQVSPKQRVAGQKVGMRYDNLDRLVDRFETDLESHWIYDAASNGIGQLAEAYTITAGIKDYRRIHTYDTLGRPSSTKQILFDGSYTSIPTYDAWGRVIAQVHQRGSAPAKVFDNRFNANGYLQQIQRGSLVLWKANSQDASQRVDRATLGNGLIETNIYNPYSGRLDEGNVRTAGNVSKSQEIYLYDSIGSVVQRSQYWEGAGYTEALGYDELNRLTSSQIGQVIQTVSFGAAGNIVNKSNVSAGDYVYPPQGANSVRPHAVSSIPGLGSFEYDLNGNLIGGGSRALSWNSFDMPVQMTKQFQGGSTTSNFVYGPEHQRTRQVRSDGVTTIYAGSQEVEISAAGTTVKTYWPAGLGVEIDRPAAATELSWIHHDRLGSPISISDRSGNLREKLAYDAWGKRRALDGSVTLDSLDGVIDNKGFTGHEMLDQLDLVHMNGRVYDPLIAQFLSADPHVTDPVNGQSYNRYSYVLNNPTNLTDPTGFDPCDSVHDNVDCYENVSYSNGGAAASLETLASKYKESAKAFFDQFTKEQTSTERDKESGAGEAPGLRARSLMSLAEKNGFDVTQKTVNAWDAASKSFIDRSIYITTRASDSLIIFIQPADHMQYLAAIESKGAPGTTTVISHGSYNALAGMVPKEAANVLRVSPGRNPLGSSFTLNACDVGKEFVRDFAKQMKMDAFGPTEKSWSLHTWSLGIYGSKTLYWPAIFNASLDVPDSSKPGTWAGFDARGVAISR